MTTVRIVEHWHVHQCLAQPRPHPWSTARTVVSVADSRPCLTPVTLRATNPANGHPFTVPIPCGRRVPLQDRCANCTPVVEVVRVSLHIRQVERNR